MAGKNQHLIRNASAAYPKDAMYGKAADYVAEANREAAMRKQLDAVVAALPILLALIERTDTGEDVQVYRR